MMLLGIMFVFVGVQFVVLLHFAFKLSELSSCYGWLKESLEENDDDDYEEEEVK